MLEIALEWLQILFETYAVTIVATMVLASIFSPQDYNLMIYPLAIGGACIITSIIGTWFVKLGKNKNIMGALYKGFIVTAVTSLLVMYPVTDSLIGLNTYLRTIMLEQNFQV